MSDTVFQLKPESLDASTGLSNHDADMLDKYLYHTEWTTWWSFNKAEFDETIGPRILKDIAELEDGDEKDDLQSFYNNLIEAKNKYPEDDDVDLLY